MAPRRRSQKSEDIDYESPQPSTPHDQMSLGLGQMSDAAAHNMMSPMAQGEYQEEANPTVGSAPVDNMPYAHMNQASGFSPTMKQAGSLDIYPPQPSLQNPNLFPLPNAGDSSNPAINPSQQTFTSLPSITDPSHALIMANASNMYGQSSAAQSIQDFTQMMNPNLRNNLQPYLLEKLVLGPGRLTAGLQFPAAYPIEVLPYRFVHEGAITKIIHEGKEYSYITTKPKGRKRANPDTNTNEQPPLRKRSAPQMTELTSLTTVNAATIPDDVELHDEMTPAERARAQAQNNSNSGLREALMRRRNNISAKRGRERRANRAKRLAKDKAQALAERNYWKARAFGLGAHDDEWDAMPADQKDDFVADFRVDIEALLYKDPEPATTVPTTLAAVTDNMPAIKQDEN